jgi:hypothetical protein
VLLCEGYKGQTPSPPDNQPANVSKKRAIGPSVSGPSKIWESVYQDPGSSQRGDPGRPTRVDLRAASMEKHPFYRPMTLPSGSEASFAGLCWNTMIGIAAIKGARTQ